MIRYQDQAIILKSSLQGERDKRLIFLTKTHGKKAAFAKGAVSSKRFGPALDLFAVSQIEWVEKNEGEIQRIESAETHHEFKAIRSDFQKMATASYFLELLLHLFPENEPLPGIYEYLANTLYDVDSRETFEQSLRTTYELKLLFLLGISPEFTACLSCSTQATHLEFLFFKASSGGILCESCTEPATPPIAKSIVMELQEIASSNFKRLRSYTPSQEFSSKVPAFLHQFMDFHVPGYERRKFKSLSFLK